MKKVFFLSCLFFLLGLFTGGEEVNAILGSPCNLKDGKNGECKTSCSFGDANAVAPSFQCNSDLSEDCCSLAIPLCNHNGTCDSGETPTNCSSDCGCNNNGICEASRGETLQNCPRDCGGGGGVTIPPDLATETGLYTTPMTVVIIVFMDWLLSIGGMIAIIAFTISGIQYLVSAGNDSMIETAKRNMMYSIVGVIVMLSGLIIITAIDAWLFGSATF